MVCYFTPLQTGAYRLLSTRDSSFWCCVGSGFESHAKYQAGIYYKGCETQKLSRELYVNLYIPSEVTWDDITVRQETAFPESNVVKLTVYQHKTPLNIKLRYPSWATYMKVNGKKVKAGKDGYVSVFINDRSSNLAPRKLIVELGMQLHEEVTKDDASRFALMYGPVVLGGRLADVDNPFSDPKKYNDYYTFDYGKHDDVKLQSLTHLHGLHFCTHDGIEVGPFYDMQRCRYVVYWRK